MGKKVDDIVLDQTLNYLKNNVTECYVVNAEPADRAACVANTIAVTTGLTSGSFTGPANGDTNGRKLTVNAINGDTAVADDTANHIALCTGTTLLYVTTCTSQAITNGNTVNYPAWDIEIADPT